MSKLNILHLSDAHLGRPDRLLDAAAVFEPLFVDLKRAFDEDNLCPSLIIFSGDLAYGELSKKSLESQYDDARIFLTKVYECFGKKLGDIPIVIVPGNHDINLTKIDKAQRAYRDVLTSDIVDSMIVENDNTWQRTVERQKDWFKFAQTIPHQTWKYNPSVYLCTGILDHNGKKIGISGFNSSWAYQGENDQGKLWIGKHQYDLAYNEIKGADFKIAVSHYPLDWLHQNDKVFLTQKIETQYQIFFHGHEHAQWFTDSPGHLKCAAGACYSGTKERNGYSWLELDLEAASALISLREYSDQGAGGWRQNSIQGKTDEKGQANLIFLKQITNEKVDLVSPLTCVPAAIALPQDLNTFLKVLENKFYFRWEKGSHSYARSDLLVYWPVRLREPSPIHAAQCYAAAGLQKMGCTIALWIDNLGNKEYNEDNFLNQFKKWFGKVGGDPTTLQVRKFTEILSDEPKHVEPAWEMLQKWLANSIYLTDHVLKVAKIWPSEGPNVKDPQNVINEIKKRRPRRLLNPSMVWTCLMVLHHEAKERPIVTLGGYDEKDLWEAWRACCEATELDVSHLYISKLTRSEQTLHMSSNKFVWSSKEDIEAALTNTLPEFYPDEWSNAHSMIPWTMNNCALLPSYVANNGYPMSIKDKCISELRDLKPLSPADIIVEITEASGSWLF